MFNSIKKYYEQERYANEQVKVFVMAKWITEEEYKLITGENYDR
jgi:uncharacterized XkdX family phage protein